MQRDLMQAKFGNLPQLELTEEEEELDSLSSLSHPPPAAATRRHGKSKDYSALAANDYFDEALEVDYSSNRTTRVYYTPVVVPSTSSLPYNPATTLPTPATAPWLKPQTLLGDDNATGVLFVCVHGAGYSGLSYAGFAKEVLLQGRGRAGVLAYDSRGHGKAPVSIDDEDGIDMTLDLLAEDLVGLLKAMFPDRSTAPKILLVGHSMGGAVAVEACPQIQREVGEVVGISVLDVVEGSALEALEGMMGVVAGQPKGFESVEQGIEWHIRTKTINNLTSARLSVPPLLTDRGEDFVPSSLRFGWRVDLEKTEQYWKGWFTGLSKKFLQCRTAKILILAGADRLDKELMIGQMQGKFQLEVYRDVGHCLQEDAPERTAATLLEFWARNDRTDVLKGVKKVGQV